VFLTAVNAPDKTREAETKVGYRTKVRINFAGGSPETEMEREGVPKRVATRLQFEQRLRPLGQNELGL
jgi:hypothetical protein